MILRLARIFFVLLSAAASIFLLWTWNTAPAGVFTAFWEPYQESPFIYGWGPAGAIETDEGNGLKIASEAAAFRLKLPAEFKNAELKIVYEEPEAPIVALSSANGKGSGDYEKKILFSRLLENLDWPKRQAGGVLIYEREPGNLPISELAAKGTPLHTLNVELSRRLGAGVGAMRTYDFSLRGSHTFWILGSGRPVEFEFQIQDMNRHAGDDPVLIEASLDGRVIASQYFDDNEGSALPGEIRAAKIIIPKNSGSVKIKFSASEDIFIRGFKTDAPKLVLAEKVFFGDDIGYGGKAEPPVLWTDSTVLSARTPHREGRQKIYFASRAFSVERSGETYYFELTAAPAGLLPVKIQKNDIELRVSGFVAFSPNDFFVPAWPEIFWNSSPPKDGAVAAKYEPPEKNNGLMVSMAEFDLNNLIREADGSYGFLLELPGYGQHGKPLVVRKISVRATK